MCSLMSLVPQERWSEEEFPVHSARQWTNSDVPDVTVRQQSWERRAPARAHAAQQWCFKGEVSDLRVQEKSRGMLTGIAFFLNGVGSVIFIVGLTQLPDLFASQGVADLWAGRYAYLSVAGIAFLVALVTLGLKPGRPDETEPHKSILTLLLEGITAAANVRIGLS